MNQNERMKRFGVSSEIWESIRAMELKPYALKEINEMTELISKLYLGHCNHKRYFLDEIVIDFIEDQHEIIYFN